MYNINTFESQEERNVEFQTTNQEGEDNIEIYDLNKIFQFSYNFDILKNIMEALIKNQQNMLKDLKSKNSKILDLQSQILDIKFLLDSPNNEKETSKPQIKSVNQQIQKLDTNPKLFSVIKGNQDILRPPPNDIKLEVSIGNDDNINAIIVS
jgi:hypothetical protein